MALRNSTKCSNNLHFYNSPYQFKPLFFFLSCLFHCLFHCPFHCFSLITTHTVVSSRSERLWNYCVVDYGCMLCRNRSYLFGLTRLIWSIYLVYLCGLFISSIHGWTRPVGRAVHASPSQIVGVALLVLGLLLQKCLGDCP